MYFILAICQKLLRSLMHHTHKILKTINRVVFYLVKYDVLYLKLKSIINNSTYKTLDYDFIIVVTQIIYSYNIFRS